MEPIDRERIEKIIRDRQAAHEALLGGKPPAAGAGGSAATYRAFLALEKAAFSAGALDRAAKELIALGISVVIDCESCMEWHIREALAAGASVEQVLEAVGVGIEMGGGPATVSARFALKALEYHSHPAPAGAQSPG